jgi:hypothetical protein
MIITVPIIGDRLPINPNQLVLTASASAGKLTKIKVKYLPLPEGKEHVIGKWFFRNSLVFPQIKTEFDEKTESMRYVIDMKDLPATPPGGSFSVDFSFSRIQENIETFSKGCLPTSIASYIANLAAPNISGMITHVPG